MSVTATTSVRVIGSRRDRLSPMREDGVRPRYHAFDALRGLAMFLVIGLHAALGYVERDIPSVLWCVRDAPTLPVFDWFCWWSMGVSNPLYFTIAGFFAVVLYDSRGFQGFLANRARRVAIPFLIEIPRSFDPSGMAVNIAGRPAISASLGPSSRAVMAAVATAVVLGTSRRTGTRPSFPVKLPMMK